MFLVTLEVRATRVQAQGLCVQAQHEVQAIASQAQQEVQATANQAEQEVLRARELAQEADKKQKTPVPKVNTAFRLRRLTLKGCMVSFKLWLE